MSSLSWTPVLPLWLIVLLYIMAVMASLLILRRIGKSGWLRLLLATVLGIYLLKPVRLETLSEPSPSSALIFLDQSGSMAVDSRGAQAARAATELQQKYRLQRWRVQNVGSARDSDTQFEKALSSGISRVASENLAAVIIVSDGIVHDGNALQRFSLLGKPIHILLAGNPDLTDRKLSVMPLPPYALVDKNAKITLRMEDAAGGPAADLIWSVDGEPQTPVKISPNKNLTLNVPVKRRGRIDVTFSVAARPGEITTENNVALVQLNAVRDRLQVLLVSGAPYPGGRLWRDTLKSDPSIDLVHFTILRLPSSFDMTPNNELSLIPFPVEQLFQERLGSFDLVIFDSFGALDLLDPGYFTNVSEYVQNGGALFVVAGSEYGGSESLSSTALADILPMVPTGLSQETNYIPQRTAEGARHPVTSALTGGWGAWFQQAQVRAAKGVTLMTGSNRQPLVQIAETGRGRVGMIASNQLWVWARGEPPGPWNDLSRRMSHWLMKEPDLDSEKLTASAAGDTLTITRRSLSPQDGSAAVFAPDGSSMPADMRKTSTGSAGNVQVSQKGIYRIVQDNLSTAVMFGGNTRELRDVRPTDKNLSFLAEKTGGTIAWLKDGLPELAFEASAGRRITGERQIPLFPGWLALMLSAGLVGLMWFSERK
jgi:hypothetical protein